ncbi:MAG: ABC transporter ATP-binding protein [Deltaproteobacteria bacterium]|nr:ABC transporter ATP-binding protein [Deltaproteobacteria bacterium]MBW1962608.1 ABC transporter ATP-binding protein [Deltaproteobacteria bacterium]MBW2154233.1 ABC transporter ATP-binding protein [Deltaproteobacteria bacterium]
MLCVDDIHTYYGKSHIVQGISFNVSAHECVALLGRNGAGKTTTLRSIMGLTPPQNGKILFKGVVIQNLPPFEISRNGIAYVPEDRQIFTTLTVMENLNLALKKHQKDDGWTIEKVLDIFPALAERRFNRGNQLSGGEQQMLTIARALMSNPDLLLLDEPTEGLAPIIVEILLEVIINLKKEGLTILLVEQNVSATRTVADNYLILQQGKIVYQGDNEDFWATPALQKKYLGI